MAVRYVTQKLVVAMSVCIVATLMICNSAAAQFNDGGFFRDVVGGVKIDTSGILTGEYNRLDSKTREQIESGLSGTVSDINDSSKLRVISVRALNELIAESANTGKALPAEALYMAGLQRIEFIIVSPETKDVLLAGPGEGFKVDDKGNVVGKTSGQPVIHLQDFLVAMRSANNARTGQGISVSIDPSEEGVKRLRELYSQVTNFDPELKTDVEKAMGPQNISLSGVPGDSRYSQILVAADYKMKRLSMGLEKAPIAEMPSLLEIAQNKKARTNRMAPRFWMECNYKPVAKSEDGKVFQIRGQGVKTLTEAGFFDKHGKAVEKKGKVNKFAQMWADSMTNRFDELSQAEPVFRELRNVIDMSVVSAIISREGLLQKVSLDIPAIQGLDKVAATPSYNVPKTVPTQCSFVKISNSWMVTASGGVQVDSWAVASKTESVASLSKVHETATNQTANRWWWNSN